MRLVALGKPFHLMVSPNRTHCIGEGSGTTLHVYSRPARYLTTDLPPKPSLTAPHSLTDG